ncbi:MAG TPA: M67 family metallopeptidase [Thermodesulfovibrionales bacterium]|nr:M67 family metallopeptidase [Thermodesulfovibrionales bacterium]
MRQLIIPQRVFDEMIAHCKKGYPYEACGILAGEGNMVSKIYTMTNIEKSPVSYLLDSKEQFNVMKDMRENNISMVAIFHSHPSSAAYPSRTDVNLAFYEDAVYAIVSLSEHTPVVKGFSINGGKIDEVEVSIHNG